jgi:hypothetical protein
VIHRLAARLGGFERDAQLQLGLALADEFAEPVRAQLQLELVLAGLGRFCGASTLAMLAGRRVLRQSGRNAPRRAFI